MPSGLIDANLSFGGSGGAVEVTIRLFEYSLDARVLTIGPSVGNVVFNPLYD